MTLVPGVIPIIDLSSLDGRALDRGSVIAAIAAAAHHWGFFQVTGHGVPAELVDRVWAETHEFFALPMAVKRAVARTRENPRGYYDRELTKNQRDRKEVFDFAAVPNPGLPDDHPDSRATVDGANRWPAALPPFRVTMLEYAAACERVGHRLLGALCAGLGLKEETLAPFFSSAHTGFARLNYYPLEDPLEPAAAATVAALGDMALHHHSDAGALTVLLQDEVGGLQVGTDRGWVDVTPLEGALVINVGDMMQIWSNDRYQAALHRVRPITDRPRFSIPFFFNPTYETDIAPLLTTVSEPARYRTVNWGEFRQARTDGDFADYGHEIQIADFRV
jgi:isopenicillin N synthase-like dioxygenase